MKVGLIDVDNIGKCRIAFPNVPLMKLSAYHKAQGDTVEWWQGFGRYDVVYKSKIFDYSPEIEYPIYADAVFEGGTGYGYDNKCYQNGKAYRLENKLPPEVERIMPNYSMYPQFEAAYGFLTRGCPRNCPFCIVSKKEGKTSERVAELADFHRGQRVIKLLDPNLLACKDHEAALLELIAGGAWVDFTQGLDIRLTTADNVELLRRVRVKQIHFAWDNPREDLTGNFKRFKEFSGIADYRKLGVYVLTNYKSTHEEDLYRIVTLRDLGYSPYVMIYDKQNAPRETRLLQRWVNNRIIFATVKTFAEYDHTRG